MFLLNVKFKVSKREDLFFNIIGMIFSICLLYIPFVTIYTILFERDMYKNRKNLYKRLKYGKPLDFIKIFEYTIYFDVDGYRLISWDDGHVSLHNDIECIISGFDPFSLYDKIMKFKILKLVNKRIEDLKLIRCYYDVNEEYREININEVTRIVNSLKKNLYV